MLPVLRIASDGQEHRISDVIDQLAPQFRLSDSERRQLLPSGKETMFSNRVRWAKTYLVQAGLLQPTKRAHFKITERGRGTVAENVAGIDNAYLSRFDEFTQFRERSRPVTATASSAPAEL